MSDSGRVEHRNPDWVPDRYPFIVMRREWFGGYLFNRFLSHTELDPLQARVLELCEGYLSIREIRDIIGREFALAQPVVERRMEAAFDLFDRFCAVHWREERKAGDYTPPQARPWGRTAEPTTLSAPIYVLWDITYACNLRCRHCLVDAGNQPPQPMSLPEICRIIDQLVDMGVLYVNFVGGEPFIRRDMFDILAYASQRPIGLSVTTNGVLVDDALVSRLAAINLFDVQVSIDGLEETHDTFRGLHGTFGKATEAVRRFSEASFRTTINTVMTKLNHNELEPMVDLAISLGTTTYKAVAFLPVGRGKQNYEHLMLTPEQLRENILQLRELGTKYEGVINIVTEENYPLLSDHDREAIPATCFPAMGCAAGISQLVIDPIGQVFACPFLHEFPAGDLQRQSLPDIWERSEILNAFRHVDKAKLKGKCHTCRYASTQCRGGCRASAYAMTGDLWAEDPLCWHAGH
jgi:radical SAM protein with 4Fe4S-binding SPASM domain